MANENGLTPVNEESHSSSKKNMSVDDRSFCEISNNEGVSMKGGLSPFGVDERSNNATNNNRINPEKSNDGDYSLGNLKKSSSKINLGDHGENDLSKSDADISDNRSNNMRKHQSLVI